MRIDICRCRLAGQYLTTPGPDRAVDVVRALGAVQAQDYTGAKWGVGQRTRNATDADVEHEIATGQILRTHVLRPTWHFVDARDIRWMLRLTAPRISASMAPANRRLELDRTVHRRANAVFTRALAGGRSLTRAELKAQLERARIVPGTGQRLAHIMMQAELDGVVCSGPHRGKQFTYALLDERAPKTPSFARDEALRELGRRYFTTRGPATPRDFAWWSGLTVADAKRAIELNAEALERVSLGDVHYWMGPEGLRTPRAARNAHLLPNYDEYFIGFRDRSAIAERVREASPVVTVTGIVPHIIVVDGQFAGLWKRKDTVVSLQPQTQLAKRESTRIVSAARRLGRFLGSTVDVRFETLRKVSSV